MLDIWDGSRLLSVSEAKVGVKSDVNPPQSEQTDQMLPLPPTGRDTSLHPPSILPHSLPPFFPTTLPLSLSFHLDGS